MVTYSQILLQPQPPLLQKLCLEPEQRIASREIKITHWRELRPQPLVQFVKLLVPTCDNPGSSGHVIASTSTDLNPIYNFVSAIAIVKYVEALQIAYSFPSCSVPTLTVVIYTVARPYKLLSLS